MGQSVLTPEEDLLGKAGEPAGRQTSVGTPHSAMEEREFGQYSETGLWGTSGETRREALKQMTTAGRQGSVACGELSFLFDVADALNVISGGERRLNT